MKKRPCTRIAAPSLLAVLGCNPAAGPVTPPTATPAAPTLAAELASAPARGVELGPLTWLEAEARLTADTVVVIPLGAAAKEHGPHLRLDNDETLARYFTGRVLAAADVVITPAVGFHHYPAFVDYPGSINLRFETAQALIVDICRSLARYGPRRFYVLNTGVSTARPLAASATELATDGILLRFTDLLDALGPVEKQVSQQEGGTHADEIETSMILYIQPDAVDMGKAVKDYQPYRKGGLKRDPNATEGVYSPTGIWGDPTLATREKGERVVESLVARILSDIEALRAAALPVVPG